MKEKIGPILKVVKLVVVAIIVGYLLGALLLAVPFLILSCLWGLTGAFYLVGSIWSILGMVLAYYALPSGKIGK